MLVVSYVITVVLSVALGAISMWYIKKRDLDKKVLNKVLFYKDDIEGKAKELERDLKNLKEVKTDDLDDALKKIRDKIKSWL